MYNQVNPADGMARAGLLLGIFCVKCCKGISTCDVPKGIEGGCQAQAPGDYTIKSFPQGALPKTGRSLSNPGLPQGSTGTTGSNSATSSAGTASASGSAATGTTKSSASGSDVLVGLAAMGLAALL
ncbi:hypothetical protein HDU91_001609 [Kappamyces sp. JEL0680]|nr:hypothetical protein HDU91_001609 [Kappamyces sp. JEL0680]